MLREIRIIQELHISSLGAILKHLERLLADVLLGLELLLLEALLLLETVASKRRADISEVADRHQGNWVCG